MQKKQKDSELFNHIIRVVIASVVHQRAHGDSAVSNTQSADPSRVEQVANRYIYIFLSLFQLYIYP